VTVVVVVILEVLKWAKPSLESNKVLLRVVLLGLTAGGLAFQDWMADGAIDWAQWSQVWAATVAVAEVTYQWLVKWLGGLIAKGES